VRKDAGVEVQVLDGARGEFTVRVDGRVVAQKTDSLPSPQDVVAAVKMQTAGAAAR
jgi:hypothetical protein